MILEDPAVAGRTGIAGAGTARMLEYQNQRVLCEVECSSPGYLVLLDSYYPGWHAYVDGKEARILVANYAFRAVEVRASKHRVEFPSSIVLWGSQCDMPGNCLWNCGCFPRTGRGSCP